MRKAEEKKGNIVRHIQSARQWLERAEHAVNSECGARGELDLILAKAEVQLAQEKRGSIAELPTKIIAHIFRPGNILTTMALAGLVVSMTLVLNIPRHFGQRTNISDMHAVRNTAQIEVPAAVALNIPLAITPSSQERREHSETPQEEKKAASESPAQYSPEAKSGNTTARSAGETAAAGQPQTASVSEQEIRALVRTAERALKSTK